MACNSALLCDIRQLRGLNWKSKLKEVKGNSFADKKFYTDVMVISIVIRY